MDDNADAFFPAVYEALGTRWWTTRHVIGTLDRRDLPVCVLAWEEGSVAAVQSLGRWLGHRRGKVLGGYLVEGSTRKDTTHWRVVPDLL